MHKLDAAGTMCAATFPGPDHSELTPAGAPKSLIHMNIKTMLF